MTAKKVKCALHRGRKFVWQGYLVAEDDSDAMKQLLQSRKFEGQGWVAQAGAVCSSFDEEDVELMVGHVGREHRTDDGVGIKELVASDKLAKDLAEKAKQEAEREAIDKMLRETYRKLEEASLERAKQATPVDTGKKRRSGRATCPSCYGAGGFTITGKGTFPCSQCNGDGQVACAVCGGVGETADSNNCVECSPYVGSVVRANRDKAPKSDQAGCARCQGSGVVTSVHRDANGNTRKFALRCTNCSPRMGSLGKVDLSPPPDRCYECNGAGTVTKTVPAAVGGSAQRTVPCPTCTPPQYPRQYQAVISRAPANRPSASCQKCYGSGVVIRVVGKGRHGYDEYESVNCPACIGLPRATPRDQAKGRTMRDGFRDAVKELDRYEQGKSSRLRELLAAKLGCPPEEISVIRREEKPEQALTWFDVRWGRGAPSKRGVVQVTWSELKAMGVQ